MKTENDHGVSQIKEKQSHGWNDSDLELTEELSANRSCIVRRSVTRP